MQVFDDFQRYALTRTRLGRKTWGQQRSRAAVNSSHQTSGWRRAISAITVRGRRAAALDGRVLAVRLLPVTAYTMKATSPNGLASS